MSQEEDDLNFVIKKMNDSGTCNDRKRRWFEKYILSSGEKDLELTEPLLKISYNETYGWSSFWLLHANFLKDNKDKLGQPFFAQMSHHFMREEADDETFIKGMWLFASRLDGFNPLSHLPRIKNLAAEFGADFSKRELLRAALGSTNSFQSTEFAPIAEMIADEIKVDGEANVFFRSLTNKLCPKAGITTDNSHSLMCPEYARTFGILTEKMSVFFNYDVIPTPPITIPLELHMHHNKEVIEQSCPEVKKAIEESLRKVVKRIANLIRKDREKFTPTLPATHSLKLDGANCG